MVKNRSVFKNIGKCVFLRGLVSVATVMVVLSPAPTLVKALTVKVKLVPDSRISGTVKLVFRPVLILVAGCEESVGL